ncbi:MAG: hypothetical protein R2755_05015 [Acidimicrobiales bacterium]
MAISLILLLVVGAVAYAAARAAAARRAGPGPDGEPGRLAGDSGEGRDGPADARETVAQLFRLGLLFAAVMLTASGLSGVLAEVLGRPDELADDPARLARALAFTVVGAPALLASGCGPAPAARRHHRGPLAAVGAVPHRRRARRAARRRDRAVRGGPLGGGRGRLRRRRPACSVVWLAVWAGHALLNRRRLRFPDHVPTAVLAGSAVGWVLTAIGAGNLLAAALEVLYDRAFADVLAGDQGRPLSRAAVSAVIGAAVWAWYWLATAGAGRSPCRGRRTRLLASLGSLVAAVVGTAVAGHRVLTWLFGDPEAATAAAHFASLPGPLAAAAVGGFGWLHHHRVVRRRTAATTRLDVHRVADYLPAAVGLVTLTVAVTTSVAALLAALAADDQLAGDGAIAAGDVITAVTLLAVGGPRGPGSGGGRNATPPTPDEPGPPPAALPAGHLRRGRAGGAGRHPQRGRRAVRGHRPRRPAAPPCTTCAYRSVWCWPPASSPATTPPCTAATGGWRPVPPRTGPTARCCARSSSSAPASPPGSWPIRWPPSCTSSSACGCGDWSA